MNIVFLIHKKHTQFPPKRSIQEPQHVMLVFQLTFRPLVCSVTAIRSPHTYSFSCPEL